METTGSSGIIYGLDDKPPPGRAFVLALQHVLTMFGATVSVPLLLGPAMRMTSTQIGILISSVMLCSGLATLLQSTWGTRLPIIQGVSFSFLGAFFAIIHKGRFYMKTDAAMRAMCTVAGMQPFTPRMGKSARTVTMKQYYEVPPDVLEDSDQLADWARRAAQIKRAA